MSKTYELTTIKDIFDKVPADRIQDCCKELGLLLAQTKSMAELMEATAKAMGVKVGAEQSIRFPEFVTWADDGKGEVTSRFIAMEGGENKEVFRLETTMRADK